MSKCGIVLKDVKKGDTVKVEGRYGYLEGKRNGYLTKAEAYSKLTLPNVFPEDSDLETETQHGFDSIGAKAVNNLVNKMVQVLFPSHVPFFKLDFSEEARLSLAAQNISDTALKEILNVATESAKRLQSKKGSLVAFIEALKQLIIGGNTLLHVPKNSNIRAIPLSNYVVDRDSYGSEIEIITKQSKNINTFDDDIKEALIEARKKKGISDDSEDVDLYTYIKRSSKDEFDVVQTSFDIVLADKQSFKQKDSEWIPLTWNLAFNRDYGNGYVEDHCGDLYATEFLSEALAKGMVLMADVKYMLRPGSITRPEDIFETDTGEVITGDLKDVSVLQLENRANFETIHSVLQEYRRSIGQAFLMGHASRRQGERVTAYEVSLDARELELSLGGQYSLFAETWQKPFANMLVRDAGLNLPDGTVEPSILTGLDALSKAGDLDKIRQYTEAMQWPASWNQGTQQITDFRTYSREVAASIGLKEVWIKSEEAMQAEQEAQAKAEQEALANQEAAKAIPGVIENQVQQAQ